MKKLIYLLSIIIGLSVCGQTVEGTPEFKEGRAAGSASEGKMKKAPKRLLVNKFSVNYQILYNDWETSKATANVGATSATLTVGFEGMEEKDFQEMTDKLYADYIEKMKASGYEIASPSELDGNKAVKDHTLISSKPSYKDKKGYVSTSPTNLQVYWDTKKDRALLAGKLGKFEAVVVDVEIEVPFMIDSESGASKLAGKALGGMSKLVASPSLRIDGKSTYVWPEVLSVLIIPLKDPLQVKGVFDESEKFRAESLSQTNTSYQIGHLKRVYSQDVNTANIQVANAEPTKYKKGVLDGMNLLLNSSADLFFMKAEGK